MTDPTPEELGPLREHRIHAGYRRVLTGFIWEIEFMIVDKIATHNCLHRGVYLSKVLDLFAEELESVPKNAGVRFRSRVLNPLLQRQLQGICDQEPGMIEKDVGETLEGAAKYYLKLDPLDPKHTNKMLHEILYIWPVRLSLSPVQGSERRYERGRKNTEFLLIERSNITDDEAALPGLRRYEYRVIKVEQLQAYYDHLLNPVSVSGFCLFDRLSDAKVSP